MATEVSIVVGATQVSVAGSIPLIDDQLLSFGTGETVKFLYETVDANANALFLVFPEGGTVDVPVLVIGDASIDNVDLGWFNGVVEPTVAVVNDAGDAYVSLDAGDDSVASAKGLYFKAAADEDIELINLSVTGTPRLYWDESEDQFRSTKGFVFDALCDVQGVWVATAEWTLPAITLSGTVTGAAQVLSNLGKTYIGDTADADVTLGLVINQGANDDTIVSMKSSDVAHGMTALTETDTFVKMAKLSAASGGLAFYAYEGTQAYALQLRGYSAADNTTKTTAALAVVLIEAFKKNGITAGAGGADSNMVAFRDGGGNSRFIFDIEGDGYYDGSWNLYADYNDLALIQDIEQELSARDGEAKTARRHALEDIGIIGKDSWHRENGKLRAMINGTRLVQLHHGALLQMNERLSLMEDRLQIKGG